MASTRILLWNANGLLPRKLELDRFLVDENIDIALISETHCTEQYSLSQSHNFRVFNAVHPSGKAQGGATVYVRKGISFTLDSTYSTEKIQLCAVRVPMGHAQISVAAAYCTPSLCTKATDFDLAFQKLSSTWIVGGDFNAKNPLWGSRTTTTRGRELAKIVYQRNLEVISNGEPTYWPSDPRRIPDVIDFFVAQNIDRACCKVTTLADLSSDHVPVILNLSARPLPLAITPSLVNRHTDWELFRSVVDGTAEHSKRIDTVADLEAAVHRFTLLLQHAAETSTPTLTPPTTTCSRELTRLLRNRRKARKRWQLVRSPSAKRELNNLCNEVKFRLCETRNKEFSSYLSGLTPTADTDYSLWKATRNFRRAPIKPLPPLQIGSEWVRDDNVKVELYAQHLEKCFMPHEIASPSLPPSQNLPDCQFSFSPKEVATVIDRLNVKKAPGADCVTARMLRELPRLGLL